MVWRLDLPSVPQFGRVGVRVPSNVLVNLRHLCGPCGFRPQKQFVRPTPTSEFTSLLRCEVDSDVSKVTDFLDPMVGVNDALPLKRLEVLPHVIRYVRERPAERDGGVTLVALPIMEVLSDRFTTCVAHLRSPEGRQYLS